MLRNVTYISPHKTALTVSLMLSLFSMIIILPLALIAVFMPVDDAGHSVAKVILGVTILAVPLFYFVFGYIFVSMGAWLYNKASKYTGGIQYESKEVPANTPPE